MSTSITYTDVQLELIEKPGSVFVEACPGAGKTQCIVERFVRRPGADSRRGVALISFTNAAVDAAKERCTQTPELMSAPNFIGTIDSFINRYVVGPGFTAHKGIAPNFKQNWDSVPYAHFRVDGVKFETEFQLGWFDFGFPSRAFFNFQKIHWRYRNSINGLEEWQRKNVQAEAARRWKKLLSSGTIDSSTSRILLDYYLGKDDYKKYLGSILAKRFSEIIVDEVQDCSPADIKLIELLGSAGIRLVMVGDLDQSIYGFRGSSIEAVRHLTSKVTQGARLDGNFRSSAAICKAVDSLRSSRASDVASGPNAVVDIPICLIRVDDFNDASPRILECASRHEITRNDVIVLAFEKRLAREAAGHAAEVFRKSSSKLVKLAEAAVVIQDPHAAAKNRSDSMAVFQRVLRSLASKELQELSEGEFLRQVDLHERQFQEASLRLASLASPYDLSGDEYCRSLKEGLTELGWKWVNAGALRTVEEKQWKAALKPSASPIRHANIHAFKGLQVPAVALVLPEATRGADDCGVTAWINEVATEPRRVLYVGASRAQKLLMLVVHSTHYQGVKERLSRDGLSYVEVPAGSR